jgi:23S rRNA (cytosine1962-C5)-methyltransferase
MDEHREASEQTQEYPVLQLKKGEDRRLRQGHLWVYSNEVDVQRTPLTGYQAGDVVLVIDHADQLLGLAYINPNVLICARLLTRNLDYAFDRSLIVHRLKVALSLRERCCTKPFYRLVFGESDALPGLVLDRFGDFIVGQIATVGMENHKADIEEAVAKVLKPRAMLWKNSGNVRKSESLPEYTETAFGDWPQTLDIEEGGLRFQVDSTQGQKTGWFYDQHANRDLLAPYVRGARVLDVFSYVGAWGLRAAAFGAKEVLCIDSSALAVAAINSNARLNQLDSIVTAIEEDAFDALKRLRAENEKFDVVIVDPPAFIKRKKDFAEGKLAYRRINELAMRLLGRDGILVSCSCSQAMSRDSLVDVIHQGARHIDRQVQILAELQQAPDHPSLPAIPETHYLKGIIARVGLY